MTDAGVRHNLPPMNEVDRFIGDIADQRRRDEARRLDDADQTALSDLIRAGLGRLGGRWPVSPS